MIEERQVRLLILGDARGLWRQPGKRYRILRGNNLSRGDELFHVSRCPQVKEDLQELPTLLMPSQIKCGKFNVANGKLFRCYPPVSDAHVPAPGSALSKVALTRMESRLKNSDSIVLQDHKNQQMSFAQDCKQICVHRRSVANCHGAPSQRTFNICSNVVFPALSRPRNRSFACLFKSPSDARVSQTVGKNNVSSLSIQIIFPIE